MDSNPPSMVAPPLSFSVLSWIHHLLPRKSQANHLTFPCFCFFIYNMIIKTQFVDAVVWLKWVKRSKLLETVPDLELVFAINIMTTTIKVMLLLLLLLLLDDKRSNQPKI